MHATQPVVAVLGALLTQSLTGACSTGATIERDVLIVGGGGTGAYSAFYLKSNTSVAVVEKDSLLGGHVHTYYDPITRKPIEYGAQGYIKNAETMAFFQQLNITWVNSTLSPYPTVVANFLNGAVEVNRKATNPTDFLSPLIKYFTAVSQFQGISQGAYDLGDNIPEDLLLPFGDFVKKYDLYDALPVVWIFAQGVGNLLAATTLYVLQNFGAPHILGLQAGYIQAANGNQEIYDRVAQSLGPDVLYNSVVRKANRTEAGVTAEVVTEAYPGDPNPRVTTIKAKKLLITIPPTAENLAPFDLDSHENTLFSLWKDVPYYVGIINQTQLPDLTNFENVDTKQNADLPLPPFVWRMETAGVPGYLFWKAVGERDEPKVQGMVEAAVTNLLKANKTVPANPVANKVVTKNHKDLGLNVNNQALKDGFYKKLYALQGSRSTWFTGNAWASDYSPLLWTFTQQRILPHLYN